MSTDPEFLTYTLDLFAGLGPISTNRMFGGTGLYLGDAMFAVVFGDTLYMKADKPLTAEYTANGSEPFQYNTKTGLRTIAGLMSLPDSALNDPEEALLWATRSFLAVQIAAENRAEAKQLKT